MREIRTEKAIVTEFDAGEDFTASILDFGTRVEFWLRKGITQQLFWTAEGDIDRKVFLKVIERTLPEFKESFPLLDNDEDMKAGAGERTFPIRKIEKRIVGEQ